MEAALLAAARTNQKRRQWQQAVEDYERYFTASGPDAAASTYIAYAKCLRQTGALPQAVDLLTRARSAYPGHERVLQELFAVYDGQSDWNSAQHVADTLIELYPENPQHYVRAGKTHAWQGNPEQASTLYQQGLALTHGVPFHTIIRQVEEHLPPTEGGIRSTYQYVGGTHNLGAIVHELGTRRYLTKISKTSRGARREQSFYSEVLPDLQSSGVVAPEYIHSQTIDGVIYMTVEMLDNIADGPELREVIDLAQRIATLDGHHVREKHPSPSAGPWLRRPTAVVHKFSGIHTEQQNRNLLARAQVLARLQKEPEAAEAVVSRVTDLILGHKLYLFIEPQAHYGVIHGDFTKLNMGRDPHSRDVKAFDWSTFRFGPRFVNMAHYTAISWTPYHEIKTAYLCNAEAGGLSRIEQIFFLYAYILMQLNRENSQPFSERLRSFIYPALDDLEECVEQFKNAEFGHLVQQLTDTRSALISLKDQARKGDELEQRHSDLADQLRSTRQLLHGVLNSRSWKASAPLRAIVDILKRIRARFWE